jgi:hypothetical protein
VRGFAISAFGYSRPWSVSEVSSFALERGQIDPTTMPCPTILPNGLWLRSACIMSEARHKRFSFQGSRLRSIDFTHIDDSRGCVIDKSAAAIRASFLSSKHSCVVDPLNSFEGCEVLGSLRSGVHRQLRFLRPRFYKSFRLFHSTNKGYRRLSVSWKQSPREFPERNHHAAEVRM